MKLKQGMTLVFVWILVLHLVWAQEANSDSLISEAGITPGTNPDTFSYKWGSFWDRISYSLTFDKETRMQKGLQIARKHLWEVKTFAENKELDKAQKAQGEYGVWISKVKENIETVSTEDPKEELERNMQLNAELEKEDRLLEGVKNDIASSSTLSVEEKEKASKIIEKADEDKEEVKRTAEEKKGKAQTKFKARFGLKEKELKEEVRKLESKSAIHRSVKGEKGEIENESTEPKKERATPIEEEAKKEERQEEKKKEEKNETSDLKGKVKERIERGGKEEKDEEELGGHGANKGDRKRKSKGD